MIQVPEKLKQLAEEGFETAYNVDSDTNATSILQSDVRSLLKSITDEQAEVVENLDSIRVAVGRVIEAVESHNADK